MKNTTNTTEIKNNKEAKDMRKERFEIIGATESEGKGFSNGLWFAESGIAQPLINKQRKYKRLFARKIL